MSKNNSNKSVDYLELFFDLVFVFAFTQVTFYLAHDLSWMGLFRGMLLISALWLGWSSYTWLGTVIDVNDSLTKISIFIVMGSVLIGGLAIPHAFGDGAVIFSVTYFITRIMQLGLFALRKNKTDVGKTYMDLVPSALTGPTILLLGSIYGRNNLELWWTISVFIEYFAMFFFMDMKKWQVSAKHFAERHSLITIVALGEIIVSIGIGVGELNITTYIIASSLLALLTVVCLWWMYFHKNAKAVEKAFHQLPSNIQPVMARNGYTYTHVPMIIGLVFYSLGVKMTLGHSLESLPQIAGIALCGGLALNILAQILFVYLGTKKISVGRLILVGFILGTMFATDYVSGMSLLELTTILIAGFVLIESWKLRKKAPART